MSSSGSVLERLADSDVDVIRDAAFEAGDAKMPEAVGLLVGHLQSENLGLQEAADMALRRIGGSETIRAVAPLLRSDDAPVRNLSMDILREVGRQDFPFLLELLRDDDPDVRIFISDILGSSGEELAVAPLCERLIEDSEVNVRYQAAVSLGELAMPQAADCLNKAMADEEWVQFAVIESLTKIGDQTSVKALLGGLDKSSDLVGSMIIDALGEVADPDAAPVLLERMKGAPTALRNKIVKALVSIMGDNPLTRLSSEEQELFTSCLLDAIKDEDESIQDAAVQGLGGLGGETASKAVLELATDLDPVTDIERLEGMARALARMGLTESLVECVRDCGWKPGMVAIRAIQGMEEPAAAEALMGSFWDKDLEMQREMVTALAGIADQNAREFFQDLVERHEDGHVLKAAIGYLGAYTTDDNVRDTLFSLLEHPYDDVKEASLEACIEAGKQGDQAITERFRELFRSPEPLHRFMATFALGHLDVEQNMDEMRQALEDEMPDVRKIALESLGELEMTGELLELITARLNDEVGEVRVAAVEVLGRCRLEDMFPYLRGALIDEDDWVRIRALEALGSCGSESAVESIQTMLHDQSTLVAIKAVESLAMIGGEAARKALSSALSSDNPEVSAAAETALGQFSGPEGDG